MLQYTFGRLRCTFGLETIHTVKVIRCRNSFSVRGFKTSITDDIGICPRMYTYTYTCICVIPLVFVYSPCIVLFSNYRVSGI